MWKENTSPATLNFKVDIPILLFFIRRSGLFYQHGEVVRIWWRNSQWGAVLHNRLQKTLNKVPLCQA